MKYGYILLIDIMCSIIWRCHLLCVYFPRQSVVVCFCCFLCLLLDVPVNIVNNYKSVFTGISLLNCRLDIAVFSCSYIHLYVMLNVWNILVTHMVLRAYSKTYTQKCSAFWYHKSIGWYRFLVINYVWYVI